MKSLDWAEEYRPRTLSEIVGHGKVIDELRSWASQWIKGTPEDRAVILYGKPGVGKTTAAHALASELGWETIELNASDQRTAKVIERIAGSASQTGTFEGARGRRLIILDEADNIHGTADRGGERAVLEVIRKTGQPVILIANELYDMSPGLRGACKALKFSGVQSRSMVPVLRKICLSEGIAFEPGVLERISEGAHGDLRSAINDLQAIAQGKREVKLEDLVTGERDIKESIFKVMLKILKGKDAMEAQDATYNLDESPEDLIHWVDENLPLEYKDPKDLASAYNYLSRADVFLGRVRRRQNYNMWRYASMLMTGGIVASRAQKYRGYTKYQPPSLWRKLGQTRARRNIRDSIASKIGKHLHVSQRFARGEMFPLFKEFLRDERYAARIAALLELEAEEIAFLLETTATTKKVQNVLEEAREIREREAERNIEIFGGFKHAPKAQEPTAYKEEAEKSAEESGEIREEKSQTTFTDFGYHG